MKRDNGMCQNSCIHLANCFRNIELLSWWEFGQQNPNLIRSLWSIIRLLLGCHSLNSCLFKYKKTDSPFCQHCTMSAEEDAMHVLFICPHNDDERHRLWNNIQNKCTPALYRNIMDMPVHERNSFILSGLNSTFVPEWSELYHAIIVYISTLYKSRLSSH